MYHAIGFGEKSKQAQKRKISRQIKPNYMQAKNLFLVDNFYHTRFEISSIKSLESFTTALIIISCHYLSIMDHGQGSLKQFENL